MGLTKGEIREVYKLMTKLLARVDSGEITLVPAAGP
jgi:hypothetical protein